VIDPKERFTERVDDYARVRPGYPPELLDLFVRTCGLEAGRVAADVGSGTGILARMLLATGARVVGVEPNAAMRGAAERELAGETRFESVDGSAEATGLADASVDVIAAGQAFHWFDAPRARAEFSRILKPEGWVVLVWNRRKDTALGRDYEAMLERFAPDYAHVRTRERSSEPNMRLFFGPSGARVARFDNEQRLDEAGLRGRLLSSSFAPPAGHPLHEPILRRLAEIYEAHAVGGRVAFAYDTVVWYARLFDPAAPDTPALTP
jgi:SAM-dependent methyltransferase